MITVRNRDYLGIDTFRTATSFNVDDGLLYVMKDGRVIGLYRDWDSVVEAKEVS